MKIAPKTSFVLLALIFATISLQAQTTGRGIYDQHCAACHGPKGNGFPLKHSSSNTLPCGQHLLATGGGSDMGSTPYCAESGPARKSKNGSANIANASPSSERC